MQDNKLKEATLILILSLGLFIAFKPKDLKSEKDRSGKKNMVKPNIEEFDLSRPLIQDSYVALIAYIDAFNNGKTSKDLEELNKDIMKEMDIKVVRISSDELAIEDINGNIVLKTKV